MTAVTVAYQGRPGAFSELAARRFLGAGAETKPCGTFADVVGAVMDRSAAYGVLPVHNALAGVVRESCRALARTSVAVLDELALPVSNALIALPGAALAGLVGVRSHPVALAQCRRFLRAHPAIAPTPDNDTAGAVERIISDRNSRVAAIASAAAAAIYGAQILAAGIEDCADNRTRFLLFTRDSYSQSPYHFS